MYFCAKLQIVFETFLIKSYKSEMKSSKFAIYPLDENTIFAMSFERDNN